MSAMTILLHLHLGQKRTIRVAGGEPTVIRATDVSVEADGQHAKSISGIRLDSTVDDRGILEIFHRAPRTGTPTLAQNPNPKTLAVVIRNPSSGEELARWTFEVIRYDPPRLGEPLHYLGRFTGPMPDLEIRAAG